MKRIHTYKLKTAALTEPISLAEAKLHLKVDVTTDDDLILALITSAREYVELYTGRALVSSTWYGYADSVDTDGIQITKVPVISITSIKYVDGAGATQTWSSAEYETDLASEPARVIAADGYSFPSIQSGLNKWTLEFVAGYPTAATVPEALRSAMYLMIGHLYEHREAASPATFNVIPLGVKSLLERYIIWR